MGGMFRLIGLGAPFRQLKPNADAVSVAKENLATEGGFAIHHLRPRHADNIANPFHEQLLWMTVPVRTSSFASYWGPRCL
jgi:hypothetical protein